MSEENVQALRRLYEEWALGNFRAAPELYDHDIVFRTWDVALQEGDVTCHGLEALLTWMRDFFGQWSDFRSEALDFIENEDKILVIERHYAKGRSSGVPVEIRAFAVWTFQDGRVVELHFIRDRAEALAAAGLSKNAHTSS
jgi:ketosteroid isomerase-like protein